MHHLWPWEKVYSKWLYDQASITCRFYVSYGRLGLRSIACNMCETSQSHRCAKFGLTGVFELAMHPCVSPYRQTPHVCIGRTHRRCTPICAWNPSILKPFLAPRGVLIDNHNFGLCSRFVTWPRFLLPHKAPLLQALTK